MNPVERLHQERVLDVLAAHDQLRAWCESFSGSQPVPVVVIAGYFVSFAIGDIVVWNSEEGFTDPPTNRSDDKFTPKRCVQAYKRLVSELAGYPKRLPQ